MTRDEKRQIKMLGSLFGGVLLFFVLGMVVRPLQTDLAHTIGVLNAKGGSAAHGAQYELGSGFFGRYTVLVTASVVPPVAGDIDMELVGPAPVNYQLTSRFPPRVPILNGRRPWYRLEGQTLKGVKPGDSVAVYVKVREPVTPGDYALVFTNAASKQEYLRMPISFTAAPAAEGGEECHE